MAWPKLLVLVRHGESEGNVRTMDERTWYSLPTHGYPLTERGRAQAAITGTFLRQRFGSFDVRYTSYYVRARETMEILCPGEKIYEDPRLAEAQRGIWHAMTREQIAEKFPEELVRKEREGLYHFRPFGGENWPDVELRIHSFLGTLARDYAGERVIIVVHGHWLVLFQKLIRHFSVEETMRQYREQLAENASVTIYENRRARLFGKTRLQLLADKIVPWEGRL